MINREADGHMKRILPALLIVLCCFAAASAEPEAFFTAPLQVINDREEHFCYELDENGGAILTDYWLPEGAEQPAVIEVPSMLDGHPLTAIGRGAFDSWNTYKSPDGWQKKYNGEAVERIVIPEGVTTLLEGAFLEANDVPVIFLPSTLTEISTAPCFIGAHAEIEFPNGNEYYSIEDGFLIDRRTESLFYCAPSARKQPLPRVRRIEDAALLNYSYWQKVLEFPDSVEYIGSSNAYDCVSLEQIIVPGSVVELADYALYCNSATSIVLNEGIKRIGAFAFTEIKAKAITVPASVEWIGYGAFLWSEPVLLNPDCAQETQAQYNSRIWSANTRDWAVLYTSDAFPARKPEIIQNENGLTFLRVTMQDGQTFLSNTLPAFTVLDEYHASDVHILMSYPVGLPEGADQEEANESDHYFLTFEYRDSDWWLTDFTDGQTWTAKAADGGFAFNDYWVPSEDSMWTYRMHDQLTGLYFDELTNAAERYLQVMAAKKSGVPETDPDMPLYYNPEGGRLYHADPDCPSVNSKYRPLSGVFHYSELDDPAFRVLLCCRICGAPERLMPEN